MPNRLIAIGDIHGYSTALAALLEAIDPRPEDVIVTLGDYCDRGPDTKTTIGILIELASRCRLVPLLGNHDEMLLEIVAGARFLIADWLSFGGNRTLWSYGCTSPEQLPAEHIDFLRGCQASYETDSHFFVHASYLERVPLAEQPPEVLRWESLRDRMPGRHYSGKTAVVGHTAQHSGEILDVGYLKCIDTYCYGGRWLTALEVHSGELWQADAYGRSRGEARRAAEGAD
ncbi:MAG TPA: serine/threonine protein phosphatase [Planctomycetes bacterium]|nr:serine/threonine protein phosphatase [Planctomycetota bacterium]